MTICITWRGREIFVYKKWSKMYGHVGWTRIINRLENTVNMRKQSLSIGIFGNHPKSDSSSRRTFKFIRLPTSTSSNVFYKIKSIAKAQIFLFMQFLHILATVLSYIHVSLIVLHFALYAYLSMIATSFLSFSPLYMCWSCSNERVICRANNILCFFSWWSFRQIVVHLIQALFTWIDR